MAKRKTLPKGFADLLKTASFDELTSVFTKCRVDAYDSFSRNTAIHLLDCPHALISWLVEQGLDVNTPNRWGKTAVENRAYFGRNKDILFLMDLGADINQVGSYGTALHAAVAGGQVDTVRLLVERGAKVDARGKYNETPVMTALMWATPSTLPELLTLIRPLLDAGSAITDEMREKLTEIATEFEWARAEFSPELLPETEAALSDLYSIFEIERVGERHTHDGHSPIDIPNGSWQDQHEYLWQFLVPSSGSAQTVQGEVVRISGRIAAEINRNGSINWDSDFKKMLKAWGKHLCTGTPLPAEQQREVNELVSGINNGEATDQEIQRLVQLSTEWVKTNPSPLPLGKVTYKR